MANLSKVFVEMQDLSKSIPSVLAILPAAGSQSAHFWQAQDTFLKEFEKFSAAWFKRRHEGTQTAMNAGKQLFEHALGDQAAAMRVFAEWQAHSMERLAEDAKDYMTMMASCTAAAVANEVEAVEESVATAKRASKPAKSEPV